MQYEIVIGLEVHVKIKSKKKLFCPCENSQDLTLKPNTHICPTCSAQPWALPILQESALHQALILAHALKCNITNPSTFDRKSYFYPDLPMGYQITQFYTPYAHDGQVTFFDDAYTNSHTIAISEAHMETDTAKSIHGDDAVYLDFNRAGTPLVEIVTEPDFRNADQVTDFLRELQRIVRFNQISDANMEQWQMRADVNISLRPHGTETYGTRIEIKNMSSFSMIQKAIQYEYERQSALLDAGESLDQETRRRDDEQWKTITMRSKDNALDYRYMPDPDLPPLSIPQHILNQADDQHINIPADHIMIYTNQYHFNKEYINVLIGSAQMNNYAQALFRTSHDPAEIMKRIAGPIIAYLNEKEINIDQLPFSQTDFVAFLDAIADDTINDHQAKIIMKDMIQTGTSPSDLIKSHGFDSAGLSAQALEKICQWVLDTNPDVVQQYHDGKTSTLGFFTGQVMRQIKWQATPQIVQKTLQTLLQ